MGRNLIHFISGNTKGILAQTSMLSGICVFIFFFFMTLSATGQNDTLKSSGDSLRFTLKKGGTTPPDSIAPALLSPNVANKKGGTTPPDSIAPALPSPDVANKKGGTLPDSLILSSSKDTLPEKKKFHIPTVLEIRQLERTVLEYSTRTLPPAVTEIFLPMDSTGQKPSVTYKRALLIPGWGQAYNRSYWKIPVVYAGLGGAGYFAYFNHKEYKNYQLAYQYATDSNPNTNPADVDAGYADYPAEGLRANREQYRTNRDQMILVIAGIYALQAVEAYVHSHLKHFEVSDDLSLQVYPSIQMPESGWASNQKSKTVAPVIGINLNF